MTKEKLHALLGTDFLYRGCNSSFSLDEALRPRAPSSTPEQGAECGDQRVQCGDSDFRCGLSVWNAVHSHEYGGNGEPTGGISTTPKVEVARKYALGGGKYAKGFIICMSVAVLEEDDGLIVSVNRSDNPSVPEDDEHWVWFKKGFFPRNAIVNIIQVSSSD